MPLYYFHQHLNGRLAEDVRGRRPVGVERNRPLRTPSPGRAFCVAGPSTPTGEQIFEN